MASKDKVEIEIILKGAAAARDVKAFVRDAEGGFKKIRRGADTAGKGFLSLSRHTDSLKRNFLSLKTAVGGLVAGFAAYKALGVAKSFLDVASSVENYRIRLTTLLGSQQAANQAMKFFNDIAAKTPATLGEVIESGTTLIAMGADYAKWIPVLNDLAAVMGMKMPEAASALGRAYAGGAGAADIFRERGILQIIKDFAKLKYSINDITKVDLPKFQKLMYEAFTDQRGKIAGAGEALSKSWTGMISMVEDAWFRFRQKVMDTDVFLTLKTSLQKFLDAIGVWKEQGKIDKWAEETARGAIDAFETIAIGAGYVADAFRGWRMILLGVKEAFLTIRHAVSEFVIFTSEKLGIETIEPLEVWKQRADDIFNKLQETNNELQRLASGESAVSKVKDAFAKLRQEVEEAKKKQAEQTEETKKGADAAKDTADQLPYIVDGVTKVVGGTKDAAGNYSIIQTTAEKMPEIIDEGAKKIQEENDLLKEQIRLLQKANQEAAKPGITSYTPGMKYGGPVLPMQGGGAIPGFGGGDRYLRALEGGEEVIDKYTARFARQYGIFDALREAAKGGGARDYMVLDLRMGEKSYPLTVEKGDVVDALMNDVRRHNMTRG
jgi:methyl-accepting chemotaxis protein